VSRPRLPLWVGRAWLVAICAVLLGVPGIALAHESRVASLALVETEPGRFLVRWVAPTVAGGEAWAPRPLFPRQCQERGAVLECGDVGLAGNIEFPALRAGATSVAVNVTWRGGQEQSHLLLPERPFLELNGMLPSPGGRLLVALQYTRIGIQHILAGFDHVLFVIGLMLLVRFGKQLVFTITAFTLAHSVTLVSAVLGIVTVPERPVEVVIALSLLLVAIECGRPGVPTLSRRYPWIVAFGFGLLHGFGFAGALSEIGLPPHQLALALGCFNLGVELGQLALVLVAWLAIRWIEKHHAAAQRESLVRIERHFVYAMGSLSTYWLLDRMFTTFG
jgi:hydrogenase/urease accessory protein HupE